MTKDELRRLIEESKNHPLFGRILVNYHPSWIYHPSVQLNEYVSLGWVQESHTGTFERGMMDPWDARGQTHMPEWEVKDPGFVYKALLASVDEFHENWYYDLWKFNCEHWARLMTMGAACCEQFRTYQSILGIGSILGIIPEFWIENAYANKVVNRD